MDLEHLATTLNRLAFTADLPSHVAGELVASATIEHYAAGQVIFREGAESHALYVVASGHVALDMHVPGRGEVRVLSLGPGDMLGWSALIGSGQMTATATALDSVEVIASSAKRLLDASSRDPTVGYELMRQVAVALSRRLVATRLQLLDLFHTPV